MYIHTMNNELQTSKSDGSFTPSEQYPFKKDLADFQRRLKATSRTTAAGGTYRRVTILEEFEFHPGKFIKLYPHKALLEGLGMEACKILIHIAVNIEWCQEKIKLTYKDVGMERRRFSKGIIELMFNNVLQKEKREWYWINVTVLIIGNIQKHSDSDSTRE
jgi:hypothetical protein